MATNANDAAMWRPMNEYERGLYDALTAASPDELRPRSRPGAVRMLDACGCVEFRAGANSTEPARVVAEAAGPLDADGVALLVSLTCRGRVPLWLEFHRFGGRTDYFPPIESFVVRAGDGIGAGPHPSP
jgi:hypothetical protein